MKLSALLASVLVVAQGVSAHYYFDVLIVNGQTSAPFQYIRDFTRATRYNPIKFSSNPPADIRDGSYADGPDIRCNQGAATKANSTQILTVTAGTEIRARLNGAGLFQHPGPSHVYLSRAPGDNVKAYDGSGDWFKIFQDSVCNSGGDYTSTAWCTYNKGYVGAKIPTGTPSGEYLMRFEHIGVHRSHVKQPEHYVSCAQIKVTNGGNGSPGPMARFPGAYKDNDFYATMSVYGGVKPFTHPGPAVWNGQSSGGGTNTTTTQPPTGSCSALYGQCGGSGYTGPKCCSQGTCTFSNEWYSQCL